MLSDSRDHQAYRARVAMREPTRAGLSGSYHHSERRRLARSRVGRALLLAWVGLPCCSCWHAPDHEVVVYAAADQDFAEPVLRQFELATGTLAQCKFDVESTKTVGLVNALIGEAKRPRCDVFWNNEILHTMRLREQGLLDSYDSPQGAAYPASVRSPEGTWYGFGARVRVLIVNTQRLAADDWPESVTELADPRWEGQVGLAKPMFGTTATHATVLFHRWGPDRARDFFRQVASNAKILSGNRQVAIAVSRGQLAWGLTDTDDAFQAQQQGHPVEIIFPDQAGDGALVIPNTLAIIKGGPHPQQARALVDFLLSANIEGQLAQGPGAQFPLHPSARVQSPLGSLDEIRAMDIDFEAAAKAWPETAAAINELF